MDEEKELNKITTILNFINNEFVEPSSGKYFDNINPATNQIISKIPDSNEKDAINAINAAKKAHKSWSLLSTSDRAKYLDKIADEIEKRLDEFAKLESQDNGKPINLAKIVDIPRAIANFRFFSRQVQQDCTNAYQMSDAINYVQRTSLGVCTLITPWNLPLYLLTWKIAPCIANGNTCVCKPSELTPMTAWLLCDIIQKVKLPPGVINIVHGYGKSIGEPLCTHEDISAISFTGGTVTGSRISSIAAPLFKKLSLELGGKNPTVVFADCDFDKTVEGVVRASFANQGQVCLCGERLFIEKSISKKFIEAFIKKTEQIYSSKIGDPATSDYGSLISLQHRKKVDDYVQLAKKEGGKVILGGESPQNLKSPFDQGAFYLPTIITGVSWKNCRSSSEEIFGPVVTIHEFEDDDELIEMCNCLDYGLAASVWTSNIKRAHLISQKIEIGMVWVNCWLYRDLRVPFGGVKQSGIGREGGVYSTDFWTNQKSICIKL